MNRLIKTTLLTVAAIAPGLSSAQKSGMLAESEYYSSYYSYGDAPGIYQFATSTGETFNIEEGVLSNMNFQGISRYMFDDDDDIEFLYRQQTGGGQISVYNVQQELTEPLLPSGADDEGVRIEQAGSGAIIIYNGAFHFESFGEDEYKLLPGNTPAFDNMLLAIQNAGLGGGNNAPDTVYVERTTRDTIYIESVQIDTVRELITERIYTSDTVYVNETITLAGDVDTVVVNRTVTTRDTVYNYTENTISRVDSVYLLGGDYLDDLNRVTSIENQLEVERLGHPYPNPASETVSIDYVTDVPTTDMFLGIYDIRGRRVEQFPVRAATPSHTISFDVSDWSPGVYVYMIWSSVGVSSTKKLIVQ